MTIPKRWRRFVEAVATGDLGRNGSLRDEADRMLSQDRASRRRVTVKRKPSRAFKAKVADVRRQRMASIREAVVERSRGRCELCHYPGSDMHHILGGSGQRRASEALDTVILVCRECHARIHRGEHLTLEALAFVPGISGAARDAVQRRIDKATR